MRVFVAGATGALGRPVVRALRARGHEVTGLTRDPARRPLLESLGAQAVVGDALDADGLARAVGRSGATHAVQLLTSLPAEGPLRPRDLAATNTLRTQGTANMVRAAEQAGLLRLVAESFMAVYGHPESDAPRGEEAPLPDPPAASPFRDAVRALRAHEALLREAGRAGRPRTVILRFGALYGPEVPSTAALLRRLRGGRMFVPAASGGLTSFVHVEDAARAVVAALEHPSPRPVYNIADDRPLFLGDALAQMAAAVGAPAPRPMPLWLLRLFAPLVAATASARLALDNGRARADLGWKPAYPSLADGVRELVR